SIRLASRGHRVTLLDAGEKLGGNLMPATVPPHKQSLERLLDNMIHQVESIDVKVELSKKADIEDIKKSGFDRIVVATGGSPVRPDLPGIENPKVMTALEVLQGKETGKTVIVVGGGLIGCETAEFLSDRGKTVFLVEMLPRIAFDIGPINRWVYIKRIKEGGIQVMTRTKLMEITENGALLEFEGKTEEMNADSVVLAVGMIPRNELAEELKKAGLEILMAGDCVETGKVSDAIRSGFLAAQSL
ncbi:FAD/NAD(P)-binding oxidoreductase, partial [Thermodesulfobacteriota bacterium]